MAAKLHDRLAKTAITHNVNMLVPWYLMASFAYYQLDTPVLTDGLFDDLCKQLDAAWDRITHRHKALIEREALAAGTCLLARENYPAIVAGAVANLLNR